MPLRPPHERSSDGDMHDKKYSIGGLPGGSGKGNAHGSCGERPGGIKAWTNIGALFVARPPCESHADRKHILFLRLVKPSGCNERRIGSPRRSVWEQVVPTSPEVGALPKVGRPFSFVPASEPAMAWCLIWLPLLSTRPEVGDNADQQRIVISDKGEVVMARWYCPPLLLRLAFALLCTGRQ